MKRINIRQNKPKPIPMDDMGDSLCYYCERTEYGKNAIYGTPNSPVFCEGAFCEEAYEKYLEDFYNACPDTEDEDFFQLKDECDWSINTDSSLNFIKDVATIVENPLTALSTRLDMIENSIHAIEEDIYDDDKKIQWLQGMLETLKEINTAPEEPVITESPMEEFFMKYNINFKKSEKEDYDKRD